MSWMIAVLLAASQADAAARVADGLDPFALAFMLISMTAVTVLMLWCFARILGGREHFDPDGTGPAHPPEPGREDERRMQGDDE